MSIEEYIQSILGQKAPDFNAAAQQQVQSIYDPQYQALNNTANYTQQRSAQAEAQLNSMYNALANGIYGQSGNINQAYGNERTQLNQSYGQGMQSIGNNYQNANNEAAALMSKLGIQAAGADPRTLQQNSDSQAFLQSLLAASNTGAQQGAAEQNKSSLDYNTAQGNSSKAAGVESRRANGQALQTALMNLENQRLQVDSQKAAAQQTLAGQYASTWATQQKDMADMAYKSYADQLDEQTKLQVAQMQSQPNSYQQYQMMGPMDKTYAEASKMFRDGNLASKAVNLALSVNPNTVRNPYEYIQKVKQAKYDAHGSDPEVDAIADDRLQTLAAFLWNQLNPGTQASYGSGYDYGK
jgi:hypothetical protein